MERDWILTGSLVIGIPLFIYILLQTNTGEMINLLQSAPIQPIIGFIITSIVLVFLFTFAWAVLLYSESIHLPFRRLISYRMIGFAISYVTPGPKIGGEITQARVASREGNEKKLLTTSIMENISHTIAGLIFDGAVIGIAIAFIPIPPFFHYVFYTLTGIALIIPFLYHIVIKEDFKPVSWIVEKLDSVGMIARKEYQKAVVNAEKYFKKYLNENQKSIVISTLILFFSKLILSIQIMFIAQMLSVNLTIPQAMLFAAVIDIAYTIPAYMGIGVLEAGQASISSVLGLTGGFGVTVALLTRVRDLTISGLGLTMLWHYREKS